VERLCACLQTWLLDRAAVIPNAVRNPSWRFVFGTTMFAALLLAALIAVQPKLIAQEAPPAAPANSKAAPPDGNAENGKLLYVKIGCYECHDRDAEGAGTGPRLAPNPLPYGAFSHQVRQPANSMPPYTSKVLSDSDLADIYAFLQTIPKPPAVASIPLLQ
jgi:mono/diheme cytochrome c family protein